MNTPLTDQLRAYFDEVDRQQGAVDLDALRGSVEERLIMIELSPDSALSPNRPTSGRRWPILIATAAAVLVVGALVVFNGDDATPADQPTVDTWLDKLIVRPLDPPIDCGLEQCPWSRELTAQALDPAFACTGTPGKPLCPLLAVSPDGTLVALDRNAGTLTWYEEEPRVVSVAVEHPPNIDEQSGFVAMAIGPQDIAYISVGPRPSALVAVAPSGAEITRVETPAAHRVSTRQRQASA